MFLRLSNSIWTGRNRINHLFLVLYLFLCLFKCLSFILNQAWSCLADKTTLDCGNSCHFAFIFCFYTLKVVIQNLHISHKLKCPGGYLCVSMCQLKKGSGFLGCCFFFLRRTSRIVTDHQPVQSVPFLLPSIRPRDQSENVRSLGEDLYSPACWWVVAEG